MRVFVILLLLRSGLSVAIPTSRRSWESEEKDEGGRMKPDRFRQGQRPLLGEQRPLFYTPVHGGE
jgi:hypothetical protein